MRPLIALSIILSVIIAQVLLTASTASAQAGPVPLSPAPVQVQSGNIVIYTPDGGPFRVGVDDAVRLDVSATTPPGTYLAVAGDTTGTVLRTQLNSLSLNSLLHPECVYGLPELVLVGATPRQLPAGPGHADPATSWRAVNLSNNRKLCCMPSLDGGVPAIACSPPADGGVELGYIGAPDYGKIEIGGEGFTDKVYCRADTTDPLVTIPVNVWEDSCIQP